MRNSSAKLKSAVYCVKLHGNVRIEDDVMARDEDEYSSCAIDCLDYGDQTTAWESAEIGEDVSEETEVSNEVVQVRRSETTVRTTRSGIGRDPEINHYTCSTIDGEISTLTKINDTNVSTWFINTKDKLLFDTSWTICATGLHRTHELTKCSGRQLTNRGAKWERTLVSGDM